VGLHTIQIDAFLVSHPNVCTYRVGHKKRGTLLLSVSSAIIDRF